ncbi:MAG: sporulation integral membrane protein YtvI [Oscillospiraceae bacterium]|nr:sporulation integral membrane protein YtvI [Oscillospiraceae bacterium]
MTEHRFLTLLLYIALCCALIFLLFRFLLPVLLPFLIGFLLSQLAEPAVRRLESRWKLPRSCASALIMAVLFLMLSLILFLLFQTCATEITKLSARLPALLEGLRGPMEALKEALLKLSDKVPDGLGLALRAWVEKLFSSTSTLIERGSGLVFSLASGVVGKVPGIFIFLVTTVVASFMISAERQTVFHWGKTRIPADWRKKLENLGGHMKQALGGWFRAELRLMGITFAMVSVGLFILGIDFPLVLGAVIAVVDALPVLGIGTVLIPWGVWSLLQGNTVLGAGLLILYGLAAATRTSLEPRLVGKQIGLNPLLALLSMYAGFQLFGFVGMIFLPIAAMLARQFWVYGGFGARTQ